MRGGVPPARLPWAAESAPGRLLEATEGEEAGSRSPQGPTLKPTCHPIGPTQSGEHQGWAEAKDLQIFRAPTPSPVNLGAEERPVRAALPSALEEALPGPSVQAPYRTGILSSAPHFQPSFNLAAK